MTSREQGHLLTIAPNGHQNETQPIQEVHSEEDTDNDGLHPTELTNGERPMKPITPSKKQTAKYAPLEKHQKPKRSLLFVLLVFIACVVIVGLILLWFYYMGIALSTTPTIAPTTAEPRHISPTSAPVIIIINETTTFMPSISPTTSKYPTVNPTDLPTHIPPTPSPITTISPNGSEIVEKGIIINVPEDAFPPGTTVTITFGEASDALKEIFDDTTSAFKAMSIGNITGNAIHLEVSNMPLTTVNITYKSTISIASDLLENCPNDYGHEIFILMQQHEFPHTTFEIFELFESIYDATEQTLTTHLFPEMFTDFGADIILSCTPGVNIVHLRRRTLLQNANYATDCKAAEIVCPLDDRCMTRTTFGIDHYGVDYASLNQQIVATTNGVIERNDNTSITYGNIIIIRGEDGSASVYGNLGEIQVRKGQVVLQGEIIGLPLPTHFHFEYVPNGRIYATKKRINPSDCFPPVVTAHPAKSPLVPPNTYAPTPAPTLAHGSITLRDSGRLADDSFAGYIDGFKVCETDIGKLNTCAINFLRPGVHTLTVEVLIANDNWGTFNVKLSDGWMFTDGTTSKDQIKDLYNPFNIASPPGWRGSWNFTVPVTFENVP